ncbi:MAG: hypothetical protein KDA44_15210 [Planctomycetales bacterium]|nr:hypothetical protein [Planctomycetales bacterium]
MRLLAVWSRALLIAALTAVGARGQTTVTWQGGATNNNWTNTSNWDSGALPTGAFDEIANVDNGGTVVINSDLNSVPSPDGPPGELIVTNNSKLDIVGSGAFLTDDSGPAVNGGATFNNGGVLALTGGATSFAANTLSFSGGGVYAPVITGTSHGLISVAGNLALGGGTLRPTIGFSPPGSQSWVLADATSISGSFALDTSATALPFGQKLVTSTTNGGVNGRQLRLDLKSVLALTVNADTGAASISSPTGSAITMTGYGVSSASGQLQSAGWSSLSSQLGGGWSIAGTPTANNLDELGGPIPPSNSSQASLTLSASSRSIGSVLNTNLPFGVVPDLKLQYVTSAGEVVQGDVQFTGLNAVNNLLLTVDPGSGQARLTNSSKTAISLRGYSILSDSGALKPANGSWNSLDDQGMVGVEEANASANNLSELIPSVANSLSLASGQSVGLGALFNTTGDRDLRVEFFYSTPLDGDFDGDGAVDQADLAAWESGYGTSFGGADFLAWQRNYGQTSASAIPRIGTGVVHYETIPAEPVAASVPEPASCQIVAMLGAIMATSVWRSRRIDKFSAVR